MSTPANYCKLICVSEHNNNKFYEMKWDGGSTFTATYGRVDSTATTITKPYSQWDKIRREKIGKGYVDVTHTVSEKVEPVSSDNVVKQVQVALTKAERFLQHMQNYTNKLVSSTYSVKAVNVTQAQVDEAQLIINELVKLSNQEDAVKNSQIISEINKKLINLYTVIPRYMGNVRDHLFPAIDPGKRFQQEQDNLDAMRSQVALLLKNSSANVLTEAPPVQTIADSLGLVIEESPVTPEIQYLIDQITANRKKIEGIYSVRKAEEDNWFTTWLSGQKNKDTRMLIHGTRCTSVIPILEQGLKIRPSGNFQFSGKVYGDGNYFSETVSKSLNYTGYDDDKILLVYEVHIGNPYVYEGWYTGNSFSLNYSELQKRGYDSTFVKAGNGLLNSEIIAYNEQQSRIRGIIHLK